MAPRIHQIKGVALAQDIVMGGYNKAAFDTGFCLCLINLKEELEPFNIGQFKIVDAMFDLRRFVDVGIDMLLIHLHGPNLALFCRYMTKRSSP